MKSMYKKFKISKKTAKPGDLMIAAKKKMQAKASKKVKKIVKSKTKKGVAIKGMM